MMVRINVRYNDILRTSLCDIFVFLSTCFYCLSCDERTTLPISTIFPSEQTGEIPILQSYINAMHSKTPSMNNNYSLYFNVPIPSKGTRSIFCDSVSSVKWIGLEQDIDEKEKYDTLSEDDIVRSQYKSFPYPPVKEKLLFREERHYSNTTLQLNNKTKLWGIFYSMHLESLNHYLYKGRNHFK